ncbi:MAG: ABC-2 family transporter protein, partial [Acidobacteriota bacterium]
MCLPANGLTACAFILAHSHSPNPKSHSHHHSRNNGDKEKLLLKFRAPKIPLSLSNILLFPILVLCGAVIYVCIFVILSSVNFWVEDRIGLSPPVFNMIAFGRYPITIYNTVI